jgi:hypothetical protein
MRCLRKGKRTVFVKERFGSRSKHSKALARVTCTRTRGPTTQPKLDHPITTLA